MGFPTVSTHLLLTIDLLEQCLLLVLRIARVKVTLSPRVVLLQAVPEARE